MNKRRGIQLPTRSGLLMLVVAVLTLASALVLLLNPAARKGPLGFGPPASMVTYNSTESSFSISYPRNWSAFPTPQGSHGDSEITAVILVAGRQAASVNVARRLVKSPRIDEIVTWGQSRAAEHPRYRPLELVPTTVDGLQGYLQEYTWLGDDRRDLLMHCLDLYLRSEVSGYALSFCSLDKDWLSLRSTFFQMEQSFTVR